MTDERWGNTRRELETELASLRGRIAELNRQEEKLIEQLRLLDTAVNTLNSLPEELMARLMGRKGKGKTVKQWQRQPPVISDPTPDTMIPAPPVVHAGHLRTKPASDRILSVLSHTQGTTAREISEVLDYDYAQVTVTLRNLEGQKKVRHEKALVGGPGLKANLWYLR